MGEHASIMRELLNLVAVAQYSLMVNDVRMILINYTHAKIMGFVLSNLLMAKEHLSATVQDLLMDQIVTCCFAVWIEYLVIIMVHAN